MLKVAVNLFYWRNGARREREVLAPAGWGRRTRGDGGSESTAGYRPLRGGPQLPASVGSPYTERPQTDVSRAGKHSSKNGYYKNTASSCFPWALTPNVLHLSSVVIKAQQSH